MKYLLILIVAFTFSVSATPAQASWLDFFFPSLKDDGYDPAETLTAPFAQPGQEGAGGETPQNAGSSKVPERDISAAEDPLKHPHRTSSVIADWLVIATSEAMTFDEDNFQTDLEQAKAYFSPGGTAQYQAFLEEKKFLKVLKSGKYKIRAYVRDAPLLLNEGPVSERYRWLFEVPVTVSYMKSEMHDYKNAEPINQNLVLTIQTGRSAEAPDGVLIERWAGKVQKLEK